MKKSNLEQTLADYKKGMKAVKKAVKELESYISSRDKNINFLTKENNSLLESNKSLRAEFDDKFKAMFGESYDMYLRGFDFEQHVVWWMHQYFRDYDLKIWQGDKCAHPYDNQEKIYPSWNKYPDLIYVNEEDKKVIALECKYTENDKFSISQKKHSEYKKFEDEIGRFMKVDIKVYIIIGCGGPSSKRPDSMYCVPVSYFEDKREIIFSDVPEYKIMIRDSYDKIINLHRNIPF